MNVPQNVGVVHVISTTGDYVGSVGLVTVIWRSILLREKKFIFYSPQNPDRMWGPKCYVPSSLDTSLPGR